MKLGAAAGREVTYTAPNTQHFGRYQESGIRSHAPRNSLSLLENRVVFLWKGWSSDPYLFTKCS
jgi:hypothetical protein